MITDYHGGTRVALVVVRHNDTTLASVSEVKLSRARLVPGWVTVQGIPSHLDQLYCS
jgi:hypothetical protein